MAFEYLRKNVPGKEEKGRSKAERQELAKAVGGTGEPLQGDGESKRQQGKGTVPVCVWKTRSDEDAAHRASPNWTQSVSLATDFPY